MLSHRPRLITQEPETWHSRQPSDNSDKDHYADKVTSPENLSLSCKQLCVGISDVPCHARSSSDLSVRLRAGSPAPLQPLHLSPRACATGLGC